MGVILAPNGRWTGRDKAGNALAGGFLFTFQNGTRVFKDTYADPGMTVLNPNPLQLDSSGSASIYWEDDDYYTIALYSVDPSAPSVPYQLVYTQNNYPQVTGGGDGPVVINQSFPNIVRNSQFTRWGSDNFQSSDTSNEIYTKLNASGETSLDGLNQNMLADDWTLLRNNTSMTIQVQRVPFALGQTEVPANPLNYLNYQCTNVGAGDTTFLQICQAFYSVQTLSNKEVSFGFWGRSTTSSTVTATFEQFFGTGGTPSPQQETTFGAYALSPVWQQFTGVITVPTVQGATRGTNENDKVLLNFRLPLNELANIDIANVQMHETNVLPEFPYLSVNDQIKRGDKTSIFANDPTGTLKFGIFDPNNVQKGWIPCFDQTIGNYESGATYPYQATINLYILIWNLIDEQYAPIFDSNGNPDTKGASAIDDWNANKRLQIIRTLGRVIGNIGQGQGLTDRQLGEFVGQESVSLTASQNGPHFHTYKQFATSGSGQAQSFDTGNIPVFFDTTNTSTSGSGSPHNNMQPTTFCTTIIKL
jgi:hypothetical protein